MFHLVVQTRYNQWQHGDRFSAALRLQTGTCAKRYGLQGEQRKGDRFIFRTGAQEMSLFPGSVSSASGEEGRDLVRKNKPGPLFHSLLT